jgi:hypothetical protein
MTPTRVFTAQHVLAPNGRTRKAMVSIALFFSLLASCLGQGTTLIGFEGPAYPGAPSPQPPGTFSIINEYIESGVWFRNPHPPENLALTGTGLAWAADDGTAYLYTSLGGTLALSFTDGAPFSLVSVNLAEGGTNSVSSMTIPLIGYRLGCGTVTNIFTVDSLVDRRANQLPDFETFSLGAGFTDLIRVEVPMGGFALDNVLLGVPEPSTGVLALLLGGLLLVRGRRSKAT